eukprot:TRINITY_DN5438_c0_g2_i3.p1 TRINITY_DN5438_c0_g2~~TRINITY_DN5438_c0_g2_i3.p1  ORF type:complete len:609 (-),score=102.86 TRINITY_DN5438_c0_g2_i3:121-1947(-)
MTSVPVSASPTPPVPLSPSASLYVGDLSQDVTEGNLFEIFNTVGYVSSIRVCRDTLTRRSLNYAYVNFHSVLDAERALDGLNNYVIHGRPCRIMWSQRDPSIRKTGIGNIFIKNLDPSIGHKELYDTFSAFGNILSCKVAMDDQGRSKGYGFVHFENQQSAESAVAHVHDHILLSKKVFVGPFIPRKVRSQQLEKSWTNVFIKDIDPSINEEELARKFGEFGVVTSAVIMRSEDGLSLGFGFANFADHDAAVKAVEALHGTKLGSKTLYCCRAQKKAEREAKLKKEWEQMKIQRYQGINLYIKNIEDEIDEERLRREFSAFGNVKSCKIMSDEKGNSKGFGFVCYAAPEEAQRAITEMNNRILTGCAKPLYVALHEPKEVRRTKLAQNAAKNMRAIPQGAPGPSVYGPTGQPVYYQAGANIPQGFVYSPQMMASMPRWQGLPIHTSYSNQMGVIPQRNSASAGVAASTAPVPNATRGRGNGSSRARGRRNNIQQLAPSPEQQPQQPPIQMQPVFNPSEMSLSQLKEFPFEQQKLLLGEHLYPLIAQHYSQLAGKITGMFLDSGWPIEELVSLLTDDAKLLERIEDAINVLQRAQLAAEEEQPQIAESQ